MLRVDDRDVDGVRRLGVFEARLDVKRARPVALLAADAAREAGELAVRERDRLGRAVVARHAALGNRAVEAVVELLVARAEGPVTATLRGGTSRRAGVRRVALGPGRAGVPRQRELVEPAVFLREVRPRCGPAADDKVHRPDEAVRDRPVGIGPRLLLHEAVPVATGGVREAGRCVRHRDAGPVFDGRRVREPVERLRHAVRRVRLGDLGVARRARRVADILDAGCGVEKTAIRLDRSGGQARGRDESPRQDEGSRGGAAGERVQPESHRRQGRWVQSLNTAGAAPIAQSRPHRSTERRLRGRCRPKTRLRHRTPRSGGRRSPP